MDCIAMLMLCKDITIFLQGMVPLLQVSYTNQFHLFWKDCDIFSCKIPMNSTISHKCDLTEDWLKLLMVFVAFFGYKQRKLANSVVETYKNVRIQICAFQLNFKLFSSSVLMSEKGAYYESPILLFRKESYYVSAKNELYDSAVYLARFLHACGAKV